MNKWCNYEDKKCIEVDGSFPLTCILDQLDQLDQLYQLDQLDKLDQLDQLDQLDSGHMNKNSTGQPFPQFSIFLINQLIFCGDPFNL